MPRYERARIAATVVLPQRCDKVAAALVARDAPGEAPHPDEPAVLCDEDRAVAKAYGVWHPIGLDAFNTAHPAAFLIDAPARRVRYAFVGRTQFERAPLDAILRAAGAGE